MRYYYTPLRIKMQHLFLLKYTQIYSIKKEIFMGILDKITNMREERHWSEYQLAEQSGLTQSTISSWYRKNTLPSIPSLQKICEAYGISLSQFFLESSEKTVLLSDTQLELLNVISRLNQSQQTTLLSFLKTL